MVVPRGLRPVVRVSVCNRLEKPKPTAASSGVRVGPPRPAPPTFRPLQQVAIGAQTQSFADHATTARYASGAVPRSAFTGIRGEACERDDLSATARAEFEEFAHQGGQDDGADAGDGDE